MAWEINLRKSTENILKRQRLLQDYIKGDLDAKDRL